jgi:hypothetical protein
MPPCTYSILLNSPAEMPPCTYSIGDWVELRAGLDFVKGIKICGNGELYNRKVGFM